MSGSTTVPAQPPGSNPTALKLHDSWFAFSSRRFAATEDTKGVGISSYYWGHLGTATVELWVDTPSIKGSKTQRLATFVGDKPAASASFEVSSCTVHKPFDEMKPNSWTAHHNWIKVSFDDCEEFPDGDKKIWLPDGVAGKGFGLWHLWLKAWQGSGTSGKQIQDDKDLKHCKQVLLAGYIPVSMEVDRRERLLRVELAHVSGDIDDVETQLFLKSVKDLPKDGSYYAMFSPFRECPDCGGKWKSPCPHPHENGDVYFPRLQLLQGEGMESPGEPLNPPRFLEPAHRWHDFSGKVFVSVFDHEMFLPEEASGEEASPRSLVAWKKIENEKRNADEFVKSGLKNPSPVNNVERFHRLLSVLDVGIDGDETIARIRREDLPTVTLLPGEPRPLDAALSQRGVALPKLANAGGDGPLNDWGNGKGPRGGDRQIRYFLIAIDEEWRKQRPEHETYYRQAFSYPQVFRENWCGITVHWSFAECGVTPWGYHLVRTAKGKVWAAPPNQYAKNYHAWGADSGRGFFPKSKYPELKAGKFIPKPGDVVGVVGGGHWTLVEGIDKTAGSQAPFDVLRTVEGNITETLPERTKGGDGWTKTSQPNANDIAAYRMISPSCSFRRTKTFAQLTKDPSNDKNCISFAIGLRTHDLIPPTAPRLELLVEQSGPFFSTGSSTGIYGPADIAAADGVKLKIRVVGASKCKCGIRANYVVRDKWDPGVELVSDLTFTKIMEKEKQGGSYKTFHKGYRFEITDEYATIQVAFPSSKPQKTRPVDLRIWGSARNCHQIFLNVKK